MSKLIIKAEYAFLVAPFCSQEETRYYLAGFNVRPSPHGSGVLICGTDGHTLGLFHAADGEVECSNKRDGDIWALDNDTLKACRPKRDIKDRWLVILPRLPATAGIIAHQLSIVPAEHAEDAKAVAREQTDLDLICHTAIIRPVDGTFPDYGRVIPEFPPYPPAKQASTFNGDYLTKFAAVSKSQSARSPRITLYSANATSPSLVQTARDDFLGVIMPITSETTWHGLPGWYTGPCEKAQEQAAQDAKVANG
jgi:hypothetical protein